jgi:hypothetical protein
MRILSFIFILLFSLVSFSYAGHLYPERYYADLGCSQLGGAREVYIEGGRIDCVTSLEAIEFEFPEKWAESIGQALYYSYITKRSPSIVYIIETEIDKKYLTKILPLLFKYGIKMYTIGVTTTFPPITIQPNINNLAYP